MKKALLPLLLALSLLLSFAPAALAEEGGQPEGLIDGDHLTAWVDEYRRGQALDRDWQDLSIGFCYTATGETWYYNADVFMYSASLYKVPVCMLMGEREAAGEFTQSDTIQGSTVQFLEEGALIRSNNDYGHVLVSYLEGSFGGKCSDQAIAYTDLPADYFPREFYDSSYYSARFMTQVMETLYLGGEERFPHVIDCLLQAQPEDYLNRSLKDRFPVAQKYGAYDQNNGYNNNHIAAIVYTPHPIVVVIMTRNISDYQTHMAVLGKFLADYALTLDEKLEAREQAAAAAAAPAPSPEPTPAPTASPAPAESPSPEPVPTPEAVPAEAAPPLPIGLYVIPAALALMAAPILSHALRRTRCRSSRR